MTSFSPQIVVDADLAVLGAPAFDDVHAGHDLHPGCEGSPRRRWQVGHVVEHAVDPEPDPKELLLRFYVDVRGAVAEPLGDEQVHDLDRRRARGDGRQLERYHTLESDLRPRLLERTRGLLKAWAHAVNPAQVGQDVGRAGHVWSDGKPRDQPDVVEKRQVAGVAHGDGDMAVLTAQGEDQVASRELLGNHPGDVGVDLAVL